MTRIILAALLALICGPVVAGDGYFMRPLTADETIENSPDKSHFAESIITRVNLYCGAKFVPSEDLSSASVQLHVTYLKKISGGARFLIGPFQGNSNVMLNLTIFDKSGAVVRTKKLWRRGSWFTGTVTFGATDSRMMKVIAQDVCATL